MPFPVTKVAWFQLDVKALEFLPPAESWLVNSNFPRASRIQVRLLKNLKTRILKIIITWSEMGKQTAQAKEVYWWQTLQILLLHFCDILNKSSQFLSFLDFIFL